MRTWPADFIDKVICGDCLEILKEIPDGSVDLVVTDPPYGIDFQSAWRIETERFDKLNGDEGIDGCWLPNCFRTMKADSPFYCFTRIDVYPQWIGLISFAGFSIKSVIVWDRIIHGLGDLEGEYAPQYDLIIYATKGRVRFRNGRPQNLISCQRVSPDKLNHPTEKPVELIEALLTHNSKPNDLILDPFLGSGTTAVAAKQLGRHFIGIEINKDYCKIAEERLKQEVLDLKTEQG